MRLWRAGTPLIYVPHLVYVHVCALCMTCVCVCVCVFMKTKGEEGGRAIERLSFPILLCFSW